MCVCVRVRAKKLEFTCKLTMSQNQTDVFFYFFGWIPNCRKDGSKQHACCILFVDSRLEGFTFRQTSSGACR